MRNQTPLSLKPIHHDGGRSQAFAAPIPATNSPSLHHTPPPLSSIAPTLAAASVASLAFYASAPAAAATATREAVRALTTRNSQKSVP